MPPQPAATAPPAPPGTLAGLKRNLTTGLALLALRRRWPPALSVSFDQVALLLLCNLLIWGALDALHAQPRAGFALDGLIGWACYLLLGLIGSALIARMESRDADTRALLVAALASTPGLQLIAWLIADAPRLRSHPLLLGTAGFLYLALLSARLLTAAFGHVRARALLTALALLLLSPWALDVLSLDTRLWVAEEEGPAAQQDEEDADQAEALFYDQPARIAAAIERVHPGEPGRTDVFFVGFAGDGDPAVFRREAQFAGEVFGERYGSVQRSVLLINDVEDRDSYPLASLSALEQTLKALTGRMDVENDVLVLFLTSHGSADGLEVQNGSLPLAQLAPADLREALDASGIRWRVIVVSACYAGVFLDELKNETTAVITAADASHTSFGCDEDRDLTWFGEAFLKDSLPQSASLPEAFRRAASLIDERENTAHEAHSHPQLFVGALMGPKLQQLELTRPAATHRSFTVRR
ncbi:MAG: hypothetical protein JOZ67_12520 [Gammaproteobacteria bacterium]|nr:hypothetical protein [Gammaproteobacteria bacterium]MBV9696029.1 hypothetical protein [Gammaproteobacteria bacterium]